MPEKLLGREIEQEILQTFIQPTVSAAPKTLLIHGAPSTGKSLVLRHHLRKIRVNHSWIQCDECVSPKILWKRIVEQVSIDSGIIKSEDYVHNSETTRSFQGFLKVFTDFFKDNRYTDLHYIVLDRADLIMENSNEVFTNFVKLQEAIQVQNVSIVFITNNLPKAIITQSIPIIEFQSYTSDEVITILSKEPLCHFPSSLEITTQSEHNFWANYVKLIVESFWSYTTNIIYLQRILRKLWREFTQPVVKGENKSDEFLRVYRKNINLFTTEFAVDDTSVFEDSKDTQITSNLPIHSKYIVIASYLASFNEQKRDWLLFSKLRDFHRLKRRNFKKAKLDSRLLAAAHFDLERLIAITHAIYNIETVDKLPTNIDFFTQLANLVSLNLLSKQGSDILNTQTKWRCNANEEFVRSIAHELGFPLDNYLD